MKRRRWILAALTVLFVLVPIAVAEAKYRGSDLLSNLGPDQGWPGSAGRYPMSAYALDTHISTGPTRWNGNTTAVLEMIFIEWPWTALVFWMTITGSLVAWAFSLNLLDPASGVLGPVTQNIRAMYSTFGNAWTEAGIAAAGLYGTYKILWKREYGEGLAALAVSAMLVVVGLFFVNQPRQIVGAVSNAATSMSLAFLGGTQGTDPGSAQQAVIDRLHRSLVLMPWVALNFDGPKHCVNPNRTDKDGFPLASGPGRTLCRDHLRADAKGYGGYAPNFLKWPAGSDQRTAEYEALKLGKVDPPADPQFAGRQIDKADAPAVDIQQQEAAPMRFVLLLCIFVALFGAGVLICFFSLIVILAGVLSLIILGFAPFAVITAWFPGRGHAFFRAWLLKLAATMFVKVVYALILSVTILVATAVGSAGGAAGGIGWLGSALLMGAVYASVFLNRKRILEMFSGPVEHHGWHGRGSYLLRHPVSIGSIKSTEDIDRRIEESHHYEEDHDVHYEGMRSERAYPGDGEPVHVRNEAGDEPERRVFIAERASPVTTSSFGYDRHEENGHRGASEVVRTHEGSETVHDHETQVVASENGNAQIRNDANSIPVEDDVRYSREDHVREERVSTRADVESGAVEVDERGEPVEDAELA